MRQEKTNKPDDTDKTIDLDKIKSLAILGDTNSGKTNLGFWYLNSYKGTRQKYLLGYPKKIDGFVSLSTFTDLFKLKDAIVYIDEIEKFVKVYDRKANYQLMEVLAFCEHKNVTIIFSTQITQFVTRGVESLIDCWATTRIDLETLKNGAKLKRVIERLADPRKNEWMLALDNGEYFEYSERNEIGENRVKKFPDQKIGKDWR